MKLFQIPTIQEVVDHIQYKMPHWPGSFSQWYGEKFWNHYQASGWRLSSNVLMKDWRAAFSSQWKDLRFPADREKLEECLKHEQQKKAIDNSVKGWGFYQNEYAKQLFEDFKQGKINKVGMASVYKWLQSDGMSFTKDEMTKLIEAAGNDKQRGRYLAVKLYFLKLIENERCEYKTGSLNG
jgi:hypothetical protein